MYLTKMEEYGAGIADYSLYVTFMCTSRFTGDILVGVVYFMFICFSSLP